MVNDIHIHVNVNTGTTGTNNQQHPTIPIGSRVKIISKCRSKGRYGTVTKIKERISVEFDGGNRETRHFVARSLQVLPPGTPRNAPPVVERDEATTTRAADENRYGRHNENHNHNNNNRHRSTAPPPPQEAFVFHDVYEQVIRIVSHTQSIRRSRIYYHTF